MKELKKENERLERPPGGVGLEAVQPELIRHINEMGKLVGQAGKPNIRLHMVQVTRRSDRTKRW